MRRTSMHLSDDRPVPARSLAAGRSGAKPDLICLSHLRWDFVFQRPQHLMSRFARDRRVFIVEEPEFIDGDPHLEVTSREPNVYVALPKLPKGVDQHTASSKLREFVDELMLSNNIQEHISWYYTPMMLGW